MTWGKLGGEGVNGRVGWVMVGWGGVREGWAGEVL